MPFLGVLGHVEPAWKGDCLTGLQHSLAQGYTGQDVNGPRAPRTPTSSAPTTTTVGANHFHDPPARSRSPPEDRQPDPRRVPAVRPDSGGPERIDAITNWMPWCAANGFALLVEWKPDPHTADPSAEGVARVATRSKRTGAVVVAATIQCWAPAKMKGAAKTAQLNKWEKAAKVRMHTARDAGVPTLLLYRRAVSADWIPLLSGIKGGPARKNVAHLGNGLPRVTSTAARSRRRR
jgi:hypothetical protein